ncbi:uncharacterized protein [Asterias amurensis]|uniref:uncharacterized protein n=1 Tax=Asterias amurensis TaxID=7602 RepID=UPI003AB875D6
MGGAFTEKFAVLIVVGIMFQDVIFSWHITIDMPPVVLVFEGEDVELECKARYANGTLIQPCYDSVLQWFVVLENAEGVYIAGCGRVVSFKNKTVEFNQDNGNLTILEVGLADDAVVKCTVLGLFGSYSSMTHLKVKKANFGVQTDGKLTPGEGESAALPCSVIDSGTTDKRNFTFEWSLNNTVLQSCDPSSEVIYSVERTGKYALHHGKTSCNLTILNVNLKDEGRYQCDVHDSFYNQSNYNSTIIDFGDQPASITTLPATTDLNEGQSTAISSLTLKTGQGSGATPLDTISRKDIVLITAVSSGLVLVAISLLVVASRLRKDRHSAVQINQTNDANRATVTFRQAPSPGSIRIGPNLSSRFEVQDVIFSWPITIDMPPVVSVFEGEDVELECKARYADGTLIQPCHGVSLKWTFLTGAENMHGDEIAQCGRVASFMNKPVEFNQDNGNLTILDIGLSDEAVVQCTVYGLVGKYSNMTHLKVKKGGVSFGTITIDMPPVVSVFEGEDVELECKARFANGTTIPPCDERYYFTFKWTFLKENMEVTDITGCYVVTSFRNKTVEFNQDNGNLKILNIGLSDEAVVRCTVIGLVGSYSNMTHLQVKKTNFGVQTDGKLTPGEGESATLPCSVIDSGTTDKRNFTFEWSLNNNILQSCNSSGEVFHSIDQTGKYALHHGKTSCNLTILNLNLKDEGRYQCDVHDSFYNQSNYNSTTIDFGDQPASITTLPATTDLNEGQSTAISSLTLKTGQGSEATPLDTIARKDIVLITAVSSGLVLVAISLLVVASRLRKDRHSAVQINQTNDANRATVTFRQAPSPGSIRIGPNLSSRFEVQDAETAYEEVRGIGDHATSTADNRNVIVHTYAEARLSLAEGEDEAQNPLPPPRGIFNQPPHWI